MSGNEQRVENLNDLVIQDDGPSGSDFKQKDFGTVSQCTTIRVCFKNLEHELCTCINRASIVVGCVAWLTNRRILEALSHCAHVSLIVQKEDFFRLNGNGQTGYARELRQLYHNIPGGINRMYSTNGHGPGAGVLSRIAMASDPEIKSVRCVGHHNSERKLAWPRMHHKFLVFCNIRPFDVFSNIEILDPYAVWTGSFNFTETGTRSFENALYLTRPEIAEAYLMEWWQVAAFSETLDWDSPWCSPEWRVGM